jgi:hypothetical protein
MLDALSWTEAGTTTMPVSSTPFVTLRNGSLNHQEEGAPGINYCGRNLPAEYRQYLNRVPKHRCERLEDSSPASLPPFNKNLKPSRDGSAECVPHTQAPASKRPSKEMRLSSPQPAQYNT